MAIKYIKEYTKVGSLHVFHNLIFFIHPLEMEDSGFELMIPGIQLSWDGLTIEYNIKRTSDAISPSPEFASYTNNYIGLMGQAVEIYNYHYLKVIDASHEAAVRLANYINENIKNNTLNKIIRKDTFITNDVFEAIMARIATFWESKDQYAHYGLRHRRGILLYGPPGTSKTSFISEIIRRYPEVNIYQHLSEGKKDQNKKIYYLDEIEEELEEGTCRAKFLKRLEGVPDNSLVVATTNRPEILDGAFFNRPGRFEEIVECQYPSKDYCIRYLKSKDSEDLADYTEGLNFTHLNELVYRVKINKESPDDAYHDLLEMAKRKEITIDRPKTTGFNFDKYLDD